MAPGHRDDTGERRDKEPPSLLGRVPREGERDQRDRPLCARCMLHRAGNRIPGRVVTAEGKVRGARRNTIDAWFRRTNSQRSDPPQPLRLMNGLPSRLPAAKGRRRLRRPARLAARASGRPSFQKGPVEVAQVPGASGAQGEVYQGAQARASAAARPASAGKRNTVEEFCAGAACERPVAALMPRRRACAWDHLGAGAESAWPDYTREDVHAASSKRRGISAGRTAGRAAPTARPRPACSSPARVRRALQPNPRRPGWRAARRARRAPPPLQPLGPRRGSRRTCEPRDARGPLKRLEQPAAARPDARARRPALSSVRAVVTGAGAEARSKK